MTIRKKQFESIIDHLDIGNSVAEKDDLLQDAMVETPVFVDIMNDKYDIVIGKKGAGKTSIYKIIQNLSEFVLSKNNLVVLSGVNAAGEPFFNQFRKEFAKYSEEDFENFWKLYIISLIYQNFIKNDIYQAKLGDIEIEIERFKKACNKAGLPEFPNIQDKIKQTSWIIGLIKSIKSLENTTTIDSTKPGILMATQKVEFRKPESETEERANSIYVNEIAEVLRVILEKSGFKLWVILDRLDEVFDRYGSVEFAGLRGLLRAYRSFDIGGKDKSILRIKLFLRDDIKQFLTNATIYKKFFAKKKIPALVATHIFSRESPTISWSEDDIGMLLLNRLLLSSRLQDYLGISTRLKEYGPDKKQDALKNHLRKKNVRIEYWNKIFPEKIQSSNSLKWLFTHLRDSNSIVTPRTAIDMLSGAIDDLKKKNMVDWKDVEKIFTEESLKSGLDKASRNKLELDLLSEFPHEQENIRLLEKAGKPKLKPQDLKKLYGKHWQEVVESLKQMGILRYVKHSGDYMIEFLFRPALKITYKY